MFLSYTMWSFRVPKSNPLFQISNAAIASSKRTCIHPVREKSTFSYRHVSISSNGFASLSSAKGTWDVSSLLPSFGAWHLLPRLSFQHGSQTLTSTLYMAKITGHVYQRTALFTNTYHFRSTQFMVRTRALIKCSRFPA